jgi:hypothetical protein
MSGMIHHSPCILCILGLKVSQPGTFTEMTGESTNQSHILLKLSVHCKFHMYLVLLLHGMYILILYHLHFGRIKQTMQVFSSTQEENSSTVTYINIPKFQLNVLNNELYSQQPSGFRVFTASFMVHKYRISIANYIILRTSNYWFWGYPVTVELFWWCRSEW